MTNTLIAIISIFIGIIGANVFGAVKKNFTMGFTANTIAGIFGSIFFIKIFGRLGFDSISIMESGDVDVVLFAINMAVSLLGAVIGLIAVKIIRNGLDKKL
jgi:uncharacterized membrane protein YeaQ/YmgE (transglycosylase-associated protein family)